MTTGFGADPLLDANGKVVTGTTASDIRRINAGLYTPGVISGCSTTPSTTGLSYAVSAGVVAIPYSSTEVVLAPVNFTAVPTTAGPSTGTRTEYIYAQQLTPGEGSADVVVKVGTSVPPRAVELDSYIVPAAMTTTSQATKTGNKKYSIPYGGGLGVLYQHRLAFNGAFFNKVTTATTSINLPTDRLIKFSLEACISAQNATRFDTADYCEVMFGVLVDGVERLIWGTGGLHQAWQNYQWTSFFNMSAGNHTVSYYRMRTVGPGTPHLHYAANKYPGLLFTVEDSGVIV